VLGRSTIGLRSSPEVGAVLGRSTIGLRAAGRQRDDQAGGRRDGARAALERIWSAEHLERLARTYWRFLTRISLGLLRILYTEQAREIVFVGRPSVLLRFHSPEYEVDEDHPMTASRTREGPWPG